MREIEGFNRDIDLTTHVHKGAIEVKYVNESIAIEFTSIQSIHLATLTIQSKQGTYVLHIKGVTKLAFLAAVQTKLKSGKGKMNKMHIL